MDVRKTVKKIATVGTVSTLMVGTTLMGAFASSAQHDLMNLPAPFVENGQADFQIVVGATAATADLIGAIDIATSFQQDSVTEQVVEVPGSSTTYSASEGLEIHQAGDALNYEEPFHLNTALQFDSNDLPVLLADGTIRDQDENEEWDYDQEIRMNATGTIGSPFVTFGTPDSEVDLPQLYVDFKQGSTDVAAYTIFVDFDEASALGANGASGTDGLQDSESITIFGKKLTFDPDNHNASSDFTLFGSETVAFLELNTPQTITVDGESYEVEVVGGNSDGSSETIILSVNGARETVSAGQSRTIGGIEVFIDDVFVTNIPTLDASATVFVGSDEFELDSTTSFSQVERNGEQLDSVHFALNDISGTANLNAVREFSFQFRPEDFDNDEDQFLLIGESVVDPMFDIEVTFAGVSPALNEDEREYIKLHRSGDQYSIAMTNREGDRYEFDILEQDTTTSSFIRYVQSGTGNAERLIVNMSEVSTLTEDNFFFTYEGSVSNAISRVLAVDSFETENGINRTTFLDLATGDRDQVEEGDQVGSTQIIVDQINDAAEQINFTSNERIVNWFVTRGDMQITFNAPTGGDGNFTNFTQANTTINLTFTEDYNGDYIDESEEVGSISWEVEFQADASDDDIEIASNNLSQGATVDSANGDGDYDDHTYFMTPYGTYVIEETDDDGSTYDIWYPPQGEAVYQVFLTPVGATISSASSAGGTITTTKVNPIAVGAAVLDTDVSLATASKNLVVVGGPCANSVAADLLGNPSDCVSGFEAGKAMIELFDLDNGKVAMLVAGWQATETQAATRAVATKDSRLEGDAVTLRVTSVDQFSISAKEETTMADEETTEE